MTTSALEAQQSQASATRRYCVIIETKIFLESVTTRIRREMLVYLKAVIKSYVKYVKKFLKRITILKQNVHFVMFILM